MGSTSAEGSRARRLFVGIQLDAGTRSACEVSIATLQQAGFAAKFEDIEKLHVTLAFLGNVESSRFESIVKAMEESARGSQPFEFILDKLAAFPHERKPRVIYVGARDAGPAFRNLGGSVRAAYAAMGFTFHDDAVAHVTIARVKDPQRPLPLVEIGLTAIAVRSLTLFESVFDKEKNTSRYVVAATAPLSEA